jgi:hypothetical protein
MYRGPLCEGAQGNSGLGHQYSNALGKGPLLRYLPAMDPTRTRKFTPSFLATLACCLSLSACATKPAPNPQSAFLTQIKALCGKAFEGRMVTSDARDADIGSQRLVMHVRDCSDTQVRIPFHVGDNRSRTWVLTPTATGLRLKHDHRHEDGSPDVSTQYGGDTANMGTNIRQEFPVDDFSKVLFLRTGSPNSVTNVWAIEIIPGQTYMYEVKRANRHFRVEFDLTKPVTQPPPPWGG